MNTGDRVMLKNGRVGTIIYIIPAHSWPKDYRAKIEENAQKFLAPPKTNRPQLLMLLDQWKKWKEPMYIVAEEPDEICWVSWCSRAIEEDLTLVVEKEFQKITHPEKFKPSYLKRNRA